MGRVYAEAGFDGRRLWTLFDTGSRSSYVREGAASAETMVQLSSPRWVGLGGAQRLREKVCEVQAAIEGKTVVVQAFVVDDLGKDDRGRAIDFLFGALAMQQWGIYPVPHEDRLDLTHYPEELTEL